MKEPLRPDDAKREALRRWNGGSVHWSRHFRQAAAAEGMTAAQAARLLVAGFVHQAADFENGSWRYRWEQGVTPIGTQSDKLLRLAALMHHQVPDFSLPDLQAAASQDSARPLRVTLVFTRGAWTLAQPATT